MSKFAIKYSKEFIKQLKTLRKNGFDAIVLDYVITKLANGEQLEPKYSIKRQ